MVDRADINRTGDKFDDWMNGRCTRMFRNGCDAKMFNVNVKTRYYSRLFAEILDKSCSGNRLAQ